MTEEINSEWDSDGNLSEDSIPLQPSGTNGNETHPIYTLDSSLTGSITYPTYANAINTGLTIECSKTILRSNDLMLSSNAIEINPLNSTNEIIIPISFTFSNKSWKYIFTYIFSILLSPLLILWSKFTGKTVGFKIRDI